MKKSCVFTSSPRHPLWTCHLPCPVNYLLHKHEDLGKEGDSGGNSYDPSARATETVDPEAHWPARLEEAKRSRLSERACGKTNIQTYKQNK